MNLVRIIKTDIIICPECYPKIKTFRKFVDLNIHLTRKHKSKYHIVIADNSASVTLRPKTSKLKRQSVLV